MVEGEMRHPESDHRSLVSGPGHPETNHAHTMQPGSQVTPHSIFSFDSVQPVQYHVQETRLMPAQHHHQPNVVYCAPPVPALYPPPPTNCQPSAPAMQYLPVNMAAPPPPPPPPPPRATTVGIEGWTTGLCDCMHDPTNALITLCVPCLTFGQVAEILDNGHTSCGTSALIYGAIGCLIGCPFLISCTYRTKLRSRYNLVESPAPDWIVHLLCECCALCQEYRELHNRGLDPSIGWHENLRLMQQQQVAMVAPPNHATMGR